MDYDIIGFDTETDPIEGQNVLPEMVCLSVSMEQNMELRSHCDDDIEDVLDVLLCGTDHIVACNAAFDLGVFARTYPHYWPVIWQALEDGRVHDIIIREKLLHLTSHGNLEFMELPGGANRKLEYNLAALVQRYLDIDIAEDKDSGDSWRKHFQELRGVKAADYPEDAATYAKHDAMYPEVIWRLQEERRETQIAETGVDPFAVESHRTACDFALTLMTAWGVRVDPDEFEKVRAWLAEELRPDKVSLLVSSGILRPAVEARPYKNGATNDDGTPKMTKGQKESVNTTKMRAHITALAEKGLVRIKKTKPSERFPEGQISYDAAWLDEHAHLDPVLEQYQHRQKLQKLLTTELPRMCQLPEREVPAPVVHPGYDVLKRTGRTSSFGSSLYPSLNIQNVDPRARRCFIPRDGYYLFSIDYSQMELGTLAQTTYRLFGQSVMRDKINAGVDLHAYLGSAIAYNSHDEFKQSCQDEGVESIDDIYDCFKALKGFGPDAGEMADFFKHYRTLAKPTGLGYPGGLGPDTFIAYAKATYGVVIDRDTAVLLRDVWRATFPEMVQYFEFINHECIDERNGPKTKTYIDNDGNEYERETDVYCYRTPMGLYRAGCDYCAAANGLGLQSPSAEGALTAVFNVTRACYDPALSSILYDDDRGYRVRPIGFIHDELVGEVRIDVAHECVTEMSRVMIESMRTITPDVEPRCEAALMLSWDKAAEAVYDDNNRLVPWMPSQEN